MGKSLSVCGEEAQYLVKTIAKLANQITYQFFYHRYKTIVLYFQAPL